MKKNTFLLLFIELTLLSISSQTFSMNIWDALEKNNIDQVEKILNDPTFDINMLNWNYITPLCAAIRLNLLDKLENLEIIKKILTHKDIDINPLDIDNKTDLINPSQLSDPERHLNILIELLKHPKTDFNKIYKNYEYEFTDNPKSDFSKKYKNYGENVLHLLSRWRNIWIEKLFDPKNTDLQELLNRKCIDINAFCYHKTILFNLCEHIHKDEHKAVKFLLENKEISVNKLAFEGIHKGKIPLHLVCGYYGSPKKVKYLLEKGALINAKNFDNQTPIEIAFEYNNLDIVKILLFKGANIDGKTIKEWQKLFNSYEEKNEAQKYCLQYIENTFKYDNFKKSGANIKSLMLERNESNYYFFKQLVARRKIKQPYIFKELKRHADPTKENKTEKNRYQKFCDVIIHCE